MPELKWNEYDVIECLEVMPNVAEYGVQHIFDVPVIAFRMVIRGEILYVKEAHVERLEVTDVVIGPSSGWATEFAAFSKTERPYGLTVALSIKPAIRIEVWEA